MERPTLYRFSPHPHLCYTSLQSVKDAASDFLDYIGYPPDSIEHQAIETWGGGNTEVDLDVDSENCEEVVTLSRYEYVD